MLQSNILPQVIEKLHQLQHNQIHIFLIAYVLLQTKYITLPLIKMKFKWMKIK